MVHRKLSTGIIVDRVSEVVEISADKVEDPPSFGSTVTSDFILGMAKLGDSVKILLDIDRVLGGGAEIDHLTITNPEPQNTCP